MADRARPFFTGLLIAPLPDRGADMDQIF